jgi:hypothetical protein
MKSKPQTAVTKAGGSNGAPGDSKTERGLREGKRSPAGLHARWDLVLFGLGLLALAFAYGVAVGKYRLFPHTVSNRAADALQDWRENWRHYLGIRSRYLAPTARTAGGVTVLDPAAASPGYTFLTMYRDGRYGASLVDLEGRTLHTWDVAFSDAFPEPKHLEVVPPDADVSIHGSQLLPNGDVILSFGLLGAARIDRCSRVLWTVPAATHHAIDHLPNGDTLMVASRKRWAAEARFPRLAPGPAGYIWEDTVLRVRPDGSVAEEVSVLDVLYGSGWQAVLFVGAATDSGIRDDDPLHLNDVDVLRAGMAEAFPMFEAGDVMLSLRNVNTVLVVDGRTWRVKWSMTGPFLMQHDPDFLPNGNILVFDNRITGETPEFGYSRVLEMDAATREVVWSYEGTDEEPLYTDSGGGQQLLPNGNVLVVESRGGRVFEVARGSGNRIVWEYVNLQEEGLVGQIGGAQHVVPGQLNFLGQGCGQAAPGESSETPAVARK